MVTKNHHKKKMWILTIEKYIGQPTQNNESGITFKYNRQHCNIKNRLELDNDISIYCRSQICGRIRWSVLNCTSNTPTSVNFYSYKILRELLWLALNYVDNKTLCMCLFISKYNVVCIFKQKQFSWNQLNSTETVDRASLSNYIVF